MTDTAPTVDQAGAQPPAPSAPAGAGAPEGGAAPAAPAAPALVPVQPGLVVRFTRKREVGGDVDVTGIVLTVSGERAKVAELGPQWDVPATALRPVSGG